MLSWCLLQTRELHIKHIHTPFGGKIRRTRAKSESNDRECKHIHRHTKSQWINQTTCEFTVKCTVFYLYISTTMTCLVNMNPYPSHAQTNIWFFYLFFKFTLCSSHFCLRHLCKLVSVYAMFMFSIFSLSLYLFLFALFVCHFTHGLKRKLESCTK